MIVNTKQMFSQAYHENVDTSAHCVSRDPLSQRAQMIPDVFILGIEPFSITTARPTIFIHLNYPHHIMNHIPTLTNRFSHSPLASLTSSFEGGAKRDVMGRNTNGMVWDLARSNHV